MRETLLRAWHEAKADAQEHQQDAEYYHEQYTTVPVGHQADAAEYYGWYQSALQKAHRAKDRMRTVEPLLRRMGALK